MRTCPQCHSETPDDVELCGECGATLRSDAKQPHTLLIDAEYDPEEERKEFEKRYGIDIGDRTVEEYLQHLTEQDYSVTIWFVLLVVAEIIGVGLFTIDLFFGLDLGVNLPLVFTGISVLLALSIFADTWAVGQFRPWAKIRWTYVLSAAIPFVGHIAAFFYLVLRRFMHEETTEHRRRLLEAGFDLS